MSEFTLHDKSSAPEGAVPLLENSEKGFGMIPGLHAVMAESPQVLEAYQTLHQLALLSLPSLNPSRTFANLFRSMFW